MLFHNYFGKRGTISPNFGPFAVRKKTQKHKKRLKKGRFSLVSLIILTILCILMSFFFHFLENAISFSFSCLYVRRFVYLSFCMLVCI